MAPVIWTPSAARSALNNRLMALRPALDVGDGPGPDLDKELEADALMRVALTVCRAWEHACPTKEALQGARCDLMDGAEKEPDARTRHLMRAAYFLTAPYFSKPLAVAAAREMDAAEAASATEAAHA